MNDFCRLPSPNNCLASLPPLQPKVLVIHPGSRNMRIGRADDPIPLTLPHVLARKVGHVSELAKPTPTRFPEQDPPLPQADPDHPDGQEVARPKVNKDAVRYPPSHLPELNHAKLKTAKPLLENDLRTRARNQKIRLLTGATASIAVISFNSEQLPEGELVPEVNDRGRMEWTEVWQRQGMAMAGISRRQDMAGGVAKDIGNKVYFGEEALNVPNFSYPSTRPLPVGAPIYELRYPFKNGMPNTAAYKSLYEWLDDVEELWGWAASKAGVPRAERHKWRCVLVLPDDWEKGAWGIVDRVVGNLGFGRVACIQESLAASWGAGFSHSVVVDMGEGKTSVTIVDDGLIVPETRMVARYGASDVSLLLLHFLFQAALPFNRPLTANLVCDRRLLDGIKEEHCHADAFGLGESMQMIQYESREPEASTRKWDAKVYEEVCLAPLVYFYPWILDYRVKLAGLAGFAGQQPTWLEKAGRTVEIQTMDGMVWEGKEVKKGKAGAVLSGRPPTPSVSAAEVETAASEHPASSSVGTPTVATAPPLLPGAPQPASSSAADGEDPTVPLALDDMIVAVLVRYYRHCQINSPRDAESRLRKLAENIFLVGGGAQLAGIAEELQDRVGVKLNERAVLPAVEAKDGTGAVPPVWVNVGVSNKVPREVDGRFVGWKGGSVFGRMDVGCKQPPRWMRCLANVSRSIPFLIPFDSYLLYRFIFSSPLGLINRPHGIAGSATTNGRAAAQCALVCSSGGSRGPNPRWQTGMCNFHQPGNDQPGNIACIRETLVLRDCVRCRNVHLVRPLGPGLVIFPPISH